jgi:hypothetical protein
MLIVGWKSDGVDRAWDYFFLGWWPLLFSLEWWGRLLVWGVWFPIVCRWRELIISRVLGRNRWPAVVPTV